FHNARAIFSRGSVARFNVLHSFAIFPASDGCVKWSLYGIAVIVLGRDGELDRLARLVHVFFGIDPNAETAIGGNHRVETGDFAPALVSDPGFHAVTQILFVLIQGGRYGDLQAPVGVQFTGLLGKLRACVIGLFAVAFAGVTFVAFAELTSF